MMIDFPTHDQLPQLQSLWLASFGDEGGFIDIFFEKGFSFERCRCITIDSQVAAALYWFETECCGQKLAYLYGVATDPKYRGQGLFRRLLDNTHSHLKNMGFSGVLLVPQREPLREMYRKLGYRDCTSVNEFFCTDAPYPVPMHAIDSKEYGILRKNYLPECSVIQEGSNLDFLSAYARFYKGMDFITAAMADGDSLFAMEFLGNREAASGVLCSLGYAQGTFRTPGEKKPFAMFHPLTTDAVTPSYFGFAFD